MTFYVLLPSPPVTGVKFNPFDFEEILTDDFHQNELLKMLTYLVYAHYFHLIKKPLLTYLHNY